MPRRRSVREAAAMCLLATLWCGPAGGAEPPPISIEKFLTMRMLRSPSGRFVAYGTNTVEVSDLVRWADGMAARLDRLLGALPPQGRPPARLALTADPASTSGWVRVAGVSPALQLVVANYETVDVHAVGRALVAGLLADFWAWGATQKTVAATVPDWLVTGTMRNMDADAREADYGAVLTAWREGRVPPLAECLAGLASDAPSNAPTAGVVVQWILSLKGKGSCIRDVISRSSGGAVPRPDWFYAAAGCSGPADLDALWERWLVERQWVVGAPGKRADWLVERIRSERLIYPADSGIPTGKPGDAPLAMADLIRERNADWAREAAASRSVRLKLLAAGRSSEIAEVLNAYCRFLEAVHAGKGEARLKALLEDADSRFAVLEAGMSGGAPGTNAAPAAPGRDGRRTQQ